MALAAFYYVALIASVILAGGDGLRLRPLTCTKPKTMLPVCGRPIIGYTIDALNYKTVPNGNKCAAGGFVGGKGHSGNVRKGIFIDVNETDDLFTASNAVLEGLIPAPEENIVRNAGKFPELKLDPPASAMGRQVPAGEEDIMKSVPGESSR